MLVERTGPRRLVVAGLGASLAGALVLLGAVIGGVGLIGIVPGFFLVTASIGLILPNATALALADHGHRAGSALALLGALQYVVGAVVAPIVGIAGTGTALPMAVVILTLSRGRGPGRGRAPRPPPEPPAETARPALSGPDWRRAHPAVARARAPTMRPPRRTRRRG
jgi:MFS family permease